MADARRSGGAPSGSGRADGADGAGGATTDAAAAPGTLATGETFAGSDVALVLTGEGTGGGAPRSTSFVWQPSNTRNASDTTRMP